MYDFSDLTRAEKRNENKGMTIYLKSNLRYIRKSMGMTQLQFSGYVDSTRSTIGAYEEGRAIPQLKFLLEIAERSGVTLDTLILKDMSKGSFPSIQQEVTPI